MPIFQQQRNPARDYENRHNPDDDPRHRVFFPRSGAGFSTFNAHVVHSGRPFSQRICGQREL
jgi:hypothetical protein